MALVDNSDGGNRRAIEQELGIEIRVVSLLHGHICGIQTGTLPPLSLTDFRNTPGDPLTFAHCPESPSQTGPSKHRMPWNVNGPAVNPFPHSSLFPLRENIDFAWAPGNLSLRLP